MTTSCVDLTKHENTGSYSVPKRRMRIAFCLKMIWILTIHSQIFRCVPFSSSTDMLNSPAAPRNKICNVACDNENHKIGSNLKTQHTLENHLEACLWFKSLFLQGWASPDRSIGLLFTYISPFTSSCQEQLMVLGNGPVCPKIPWW